MKEKKEKKEKKEVSGDDYENIFMSISREENETLVKANEHFNAHNGLKLSRQKFMLKLIYDYSKQNNI